MKILFSRSNLTRKAKYQILTSIYVNNNKKYCRKLALSSKSFTHLQNMNKTYLKLKKASIFTPKIINFKKNYIDFEYLPFLTLDSIIEKLIFAHQFDKTKNILNIYISFMSKLKEVKALPYKNKNFTKLFDPHELYNREGEEFCFDKSNLDYNLDNLLFDDNKNSLYLIDWEWALDFPLPKNYIVFRSIFYLTSKLQSLITTFCSKDFQCYEILSNHFVPKMWWDLFDFSQKDVERFLFYESRFQNLVNNVKIDFKKSIVLHEKKLIQDRVSLNLDSYIKNIIVQKSLSTDKSTNNIEEIKTKYEQITIEFKKINLENKKLLNILNKIESAKFFKLWQRYCNIRDKFLKHNEKKI